MKKKIFTVEKFELLDGILKDYAYLTTNESRIIEEILLNHFLPTNENARFWIENYLYSESGCLIEFLHAIFSSNASGLDFIARYNNLYDFVVFAKNLEYESQNFISDYNPTLHHLISQIHSIMLLLQTKAEEQNDVFRSEQINAQCLLAEKYINQITRIGKINDYQTEQVSNISKFSIYLLFAFIVDNWEYIGCSTFTFRLLSDLMELTTQLNDTPKSRITALELIKTASIEW